MSRSRLLRRSVAAAIVGLLALPGPHMVLGSDAAAGGCASERHGCGHPSLNDACCCDGQGLPQATAPAAAASIAPAPQAAPTPAPAIAVPDAALEARLSSMPTHGFASADLSILLSTFLI